MAESFHGSMLQRFKDIFNHMREVFQFLVKGFLLMSLESMQGLVERDIQVIYLPDHHIPTFTQGWTSSGTKHDMKTTENTENYRVPTLQLGTAE